MALKFIGTATELFVSGNSELQLTADDIETQISALLPIGFQNTLKIKAINVAFLEGDLGMMVALRGVATIPTNPVSVTCGFGIAVRGTLRFDQASSAIYFEPLEFSQVSILPGEDMPVVETVISSAFEIVGAAVRGVGKGATVASDVASAGAGYLSRGAGFLTKRLPKFLQRGAATAGSAVSNTLGAVVGSIGSGYTAVERAVSGVVITAAQSVFKNVPIYSFKNDELGRQAKQLVEAVYVKDGMLRVQLSSARHGELTRWRYAVGGVMGVVLLGVGVIYWW